MRRKDLYFEYDFEQYGTEILRFPLLKQRPQNKSVLFKFKDCFSSFLLSISSTFYAHILRWYFGAKNYKAEK
jgi:hypothetical protein